MDWPHAAGWIGYHVNIAQHRLRQCLDAELWAIGITAPQNAALLAIADNPRSSNADWARAAFVMPQTMQATALESAVRTKVPDAPAPARQPQSLLRWDRGGRPFRRRLAYQPV